jgi:hypothetical protein
MPIACQLPTFVLHRLRSQRPGRTDFAGSGRDATQPSPCSSAPEWAGNELARGACCRSGLTNDSRDSRGAKRAHLREDPRKERDSRRN